MHPCTNMTHVAVTCDFQSMLYSAESAEKSMSPRIWGDHSPEDGSVPRERQALKQPMCETTTPLRHIIGVKVNKPPRQHDTHITRAVTFTFLSPRKGPIQQTTYWPLQQV